LPQPILGFLRPLSIFLFQSRGNTLGQDLGPCYNGGELGVLLLAEKKLTPSVILNMKADIIDAGGNEVLWIGHLRADGLVDAVEAAARGNQGAVGALFPHMEKGDVILHNHPSGNLVPSNPDLNIASQLGNNGIGFYIVNNELSEVYVVSEPVLLKVTENLDEEEAGPSDIPRGHF
jgi:ATP-dependent DNA helicase DinG